MASNAPGINPAYLLDPSLYGDQQSINQQQALAAELMKQGLTPMEGTQMAGNVALRNSPTQSIAKIAALLSGQNLQSQVNQANQALMQRQFAANGQLVNGPQTQGQAQGQGAPGAPPGMIPRLPGDSTGMLSQILLGSDPTKYAELTASGTSDLAKQLAGQGIYPGDPRYAKAMGDAQFKANYVAPNEIKQGNTATDPRTNLPIGFGVKVPDNAQPTFDATGRMTRVDPVPGAQDVVTGNRIAETANDVVDVPLPNGQTQKMTKAQFLAQIGGGNTPYSFNVAPGTEGKFRDALVKSGDRGALAAFDARKTGMPGMTTGQSTADAASSKTGAQSVSERNHAILADANAAPQDIESLNKMLKLTETAQFGPGAANVAKWKAMAAQFPGMNLIINPATLEQQQANVTEMKKYMSNMAGRMSGSSGTGTDARLQNAIDSLPNDAAPNEAIRRVAPMLIAQRTARLDEARIRSSLGSDPAAIQQFETQWRGAYNPLAYEATLATRGMTPQQAAAYVSKNYTPAQAAEIAKSRAELRQLGVQF